MPRSLAPGPPIGRASNNTKRMIGVVDATGDMLGSGQAPAWRRHHPDRLRLQEPRGHDRPRDTQPRRVLPTPTRPSSRVNRPTEPAGEPQNWARRASSVSSGRSRMNLFSSREQVNRCPTPGLPDEASHVVRPQPSWRTPSGGTSVGGAPDPLCPGLTRPIATAPDSSHTSGSREMNSSGVTAPPA